MTIMAKIIPFLDRPSLLSSLYILHRAEAFGSCLPPMHSLILLY